MTQLDFRRPKSHQFRYLNLNEKRKKERESNENLGGTNHIGVSFHSIQNAKQWGLVTCQVRICKRGGGGGRRRSSTVLSPWFSICVYFYSTLSPFLSFNISFLYYK